MNKTKDTLLSDLDWDLQPSRDLWPDISAKLERDLHTHQGTARNETDTGSIAVHKSRFSHTWMPAAMAACLMIAIGSLSLSYYAMERNNEYMAQHAALQATVLMQHQETIRAIEAQHQDVKTRLVALLNNEGGSLNPSLVADAKAVLDTTETASEQIKRAIENSPDKQAYLRMLVNTYQRETDLLKRIKLGQELSI